MSEEQSAFSVEDAARGLLAPEPEQGQPETEEEADVAEAEDVEPEAEAETPEPEDGQPEEVEADAESDETDEVQEAEDDDDDPTITLSDGEEIKFSELQSGYMRQKDYTQKTMALSEDRKQFESERQQVTEHLKQQYAQLEDQLATFAIEQVQEPDWEKVKPEDYPRTRAEYDKAVKRREEARQAYQQLKQQQHAETLQREQQAMYQAFPQWRDPAVFQQDVSEMMSLAGEYGFSQEEMAGITDHRMFRVLDALKRLKKAEDKRKTSAAKVAKRVAQTQKKPAPRSKPAKDQEANNARRQKLDRLKKTHSLHDAAAAIIME
jgi:hypothetical protein